MTATAAAARPVSPTTAASGIFVSHHMARATALGERLPALVTDPDAFMAAVEAGLADLADPAVIEGIHRVTPGLGPVMGVRLPLLEAAHRAFIRGVKGASTAQLLEVTERLLGHEMGDVRWFGMWNLERLLPADPEATWQLMGRAAAEAGEWISVDTLAHPYGAGILLDARRWSDLEQLAHSPSRWERRLVGSTLATMPHVKRVSGGKDRIVTTRALSLIGELIGDAEPDVQKALSWALRTHAALDPAATSAFLEAETNTARATADGHRAWVIRDSLSKLPAATAGELKMALAGIRRTPGAPSTSSAARATLPAAAAALTATAQTPGAAQRSAARRRED